MNIFGRNFDHPNNIITGEVKEPSSKVTDEEQLELDEIRPSKADINRDMKNDNESIADKILKNRGNLSN